MKLPINISLDKVWGSAALCLGMILGFSRAISPHDYWWAIVAGRYIDTNHQVPTQNLFLYTMPSDAPFLNQPWFSQWAMFKVHALGGPALGVILLGVICAGFAAVVVFSARRDGASTQVAVVLAILALALCATVTSVRTSMYSMIPTVLVASLLFGANRGTLKRENAIWFVPLLTVFWANVHGSFVVAVVWAWMLAADFVIRVVALKRPESSTMKRSIGVAIATTIAGMMNPLGIDTYTYVVKLALESTVKHSVTEWQPPAWDEAAGLMLLGWIVATVVVLVRRRRSVTFFGLAALGLSIYLGTTAIRNLLFPAVVLSLIVAPCIPSRDVEKTESPVWQIWLNAALILLGVIGALLCAPGTGTFEEIRGITRRQGPGQGVMRPANAFFAIEHDERTFHDQSIGGMIEFFQGEQSAFVDQRIELVPDTVWDDYYTLSRAEEGWREIVERYEISRFVLHPQEQTRLIQALILADDYRLVRYEEEHIVFESFDRL